MRLSPHDIYFDLYICIDIIIALVGRIPRGTGLVALLSSALMGAVSGSGPGNVAATGSVTIPMMIRSGYPPEFAAGVAMAGSCLGPVIPPSSTIIASFACLGMVAGYESYSFSDFWMVMYGVSFWFILHRIVQFYIMYAALGIKITGAGDGPSLKAAWKKGWRSFALVLVILLPFVLDSVFGDWFASVMGETAARYFSSAILVFTPGVASAYALLISRGRERLRLKELADSIATDLRPICSLAMVLLFSYAISALLNKSDTVAAAETFLMGMELPSIGMMLVLIMLVTILGMFMAGTSLIALLGPVYILILQHYGVDPVVVAAIMPVLFVSLGQMTPPFAVCLFAAMGIAQSDFGKTCLHAILWSIPQALITLLILLGVLPVLAA